MLFLIFISVKLHIAGHRSWR